MADRIDTNYQKNTIQTPLQDEARVRQDNKENASEVTDTVSLGAAEKSSETYGPGLKVAPAYELLRNLVIKTLQDQGVSAQISTAEIDLDLTTMTPEEAQELVAEDGYFGVEQTSDRIVDFAINAFGQDPARLEEMKDAIDQGFLEAQDAFGGALPEISQQTYEAIMNKLDAFAAESEQASE